MAVAVRGREATAVIRELAERQHGVVARWQLLDLDLSPGVFRSRCENDTLVPLFQGVFAVGHQRLTREGRWMAAVLACGPGAVLSHFSAGHLWGICGSYGPNEVLRQSGGLKPEGHRGVRLHQTRRLWSYEVTVERGIPVAAMERVLLDLSGRTDSKRLERIVVQAYKSGKLSWGAIGSHHHAQAWVQGGRQASADCPRSRTGGAGDEICLRGRLPLPLPAS